MVRIVCLLAVILLARAARADDREPAEAARINERGKTLVGEGDYTGAVEQFRAALRIGARPKYMFNLAQALRLANRCREAIRAYQQFLAEVPDDEDAVIARNNVAACAATLPPELARPAWYRDRVADGLAIGGAVALAGSAALFAIGDHHAARANTAMQYSSYEAEAAAAHRDRVAGWIAGVTGGALVAAGVVRWVW